MMNFSCCYDHNGLSQTYDIMKEKGRTVFKEDFTDETESGLGVGSRIAESSTVGMRNRMQADCAGLGLGYRHAGYREMNTLTGRKW